MLKARFLLVSGLCALLHNAVMIGGDRIGLHYASSSIASYALVVLVGFALHAGFTYRSSPTLGGLVRYALAMAMNLPLSLALLFVLCDLLRIPMSMAAPTATIMLVAWNFVATRWAILRRLAPLVGRTDVRTDA